MAETITCSLCGHNFDPALNPSCSTCPIHQGCQMVCCPNCGNTNINPAESKLVRWLSKMIQGHQNEPGILEAKH